MQVKGLTMTLHFDRATEAIAHFIGLFEIKFEEMRLRDAYEEFKALEAVRPEPPELPSVPVVVKAPYELGDFNPEVLYQPLAPELVGVAPWSYVSLSPPQLPSSGQVAEFSKPASLAQHWSTSASRTGELQIDPPGSVAVFNSQYIRLSDNDVVSLGGHGLEFSLRTDDSVLLADLIQGAQQASPLESAEEPGSAGELAAFIHTASQELDAYAAEEGGQETVFIAKSGAIDGIYVNGELVDEAPRFEDYRPAPEESLEASPATSTEASGAFASGGGTVTIEASVELEAGGNTLVNSVVLTNNWLQSHVLAVAGDHVELNAIVQINAWYDSDLLSASLNNWTLTQGNPTQAFNIAMFKHLDPSTGENTQAASGDFPKGWVVTEIKGDLMIVNWLEQFTFMSDEDIAVLACSGATTSIVAGGNTALNKVSLAELGSYYDLIFIGGNLYDANIIQQLNILLDNDLVGAVNGFGTSGEGSVSAGGNLLWNYAGIVEAGGATCVKPLPQSYLDALSDLADGKKSASAEVLRDDVFAGLKGLKVLHVSGDLINLNYVKQTNILGDSDKVALAKNALAKGSDADWMISTGSNTLVNHAGIVDVDTGKTIYVGGEAYSDEVLIQAELIESEPYLGGQDPDALVSEAVAFLGEDMMAPEPGPQPLDSGPAASPSIETNNADPMHSMLA